MAELLDFDVVVAADRVAAGGNRRRAAARPDEDAITLAVRVAGELVERGPAPRCLIFASLTPPYDQGGCAQVIAEMLGLQGDLLAFELTSTLRDGVCAARLALALTDHVDGPVLVIAAHADRDDPRSGDGAVALLIGEDSTGSLGALEASGSYVEDLRDAWRLRGAARVTDADRSFVAAIGTEHLARRALERSSVGPSKSALVSGPDQRVAARIERELGGPGDGLAGAVGPLGAAHPLARMVLELAEPGHVLGLGSGMADALRYAPARGATARVAAIRDRIEREARDCDALTAHTAAADFDPYTSVPRAWRDRGRDLRLAGILPGNDGIPARRAVQGSVVTCTTDHLFPTGVLQMAVLDIDGGGRFFGQVAHGESVGIGDRACLVPRLLHRGGGLNQYFWKVQPCP